MSADLTVAIIAAGGVIAGSVLTFAFDFIRGRSQRRYEDQAEYRRSLRDASADLAASLTTYTWTAANVGSSPTQGQRAEIDQLHQQARIAYERVRLLSDSVEVQEHGRMALRHAYAIKEVAAGRADPRPDGVRPRDRFDAAFTAFLESVRCELGMANPGNLFYLP